MNLNTIPGSRLRGFCLAVSLTLILGACSTTPSDPHANEFAMVPAQRGGTGKNPNNPNHKTNATYGVGDADDSAMDSADESLPPEQYPDLFARLRSSYRLDPEDRPAINSQIAFFVNRPASLNRTFERAERYLYYITTELEARHMPAELAMLPVIESSYNPYAYSRARAAGIWQFIAPTATRYQVRVNWWQDGRRDITDSTRAALDYLQVLHDRFGDWLLAIAAYNCGEMAVQRAVDRNRAAGLPIDFWSLKLPTETRGYVPELLAIARIVEHPDWYGLAFSPIPNKPYFARVELPGQIDLRVAAELAGVSTAELHALNPAFNRWATDPGGSYALLVPYESAPDFLNNVNQLAPEVRMPLERHVILNGETMSTLARARDFPPATISMLNPTLGSVLSPGTEVLLPASNIAPLRAGLIIEGEGHAARIAKAGPERLRVYVVRHGDTLWSIAQRHHMDVKQLAAMNGMRGSRSSLSAGAKLKLSEHAKPEEPKARSARTEAPVLLASNEPTLGVHTPAAGKKAAGKPAKRSTNSKNPKKTAAKTPKKLQYTVRNGDSLARISEHFEVSVAQLKQWNSLPGSLVHPGQKLVVYLDHKHDVGG